MLDKKRGSLGAVLGALLLIPTLSFIRAEESVSTQERPLPSAGKAVAAVPAPEEIERAIFEAVNRERVARGLAAVKVSSALTEMARKHSEDMSGRGLLSHFSAAGKSYTERLEAGRVLFAANGENVAKSDSFDPTLVHEALMKSRDHRENILKPEFDELGVGVVKGPAGTYYVTQDFIRSVVVRDEAEARTFLLAALDRIRQSQGLRPLIPVDDVHKTAQAFALARSEGRTDRAVPSEYGETRVDFYAGPGLDGLVSAMEAHPLDRYRLAGVGVRFARTSEYPGGAYYVCVFLLVGDEALRWSEEERIRAVLGALNGIRATQGRGPLRLDRALGREAAELNRRYQSDGTVPRAMNTNAVAVFYETPRLDLLEPELFRRIADKAKKVGISVLPVSAGGGLNVNFLVVLLLED